MFNCDNLIGLSLQKALEALNGRQHIVTYYNSDKQKKSDEQLIIAARERDNYIQLIVGEFFCNIKD